MSEEYPVYTSAEAVRAQNSALDAELDRIDPTQLHVVQPDGEWTLAVLLGHLGEFPAFFATDLAQELRAPGSPVGRTQEHAGRNQALAAAPQQELAQLRAAIIQAQTQLATTLAQLTDADLTRTLDNRRYGLEPFFAYLDRYILGHKAAHLEQLRRLRNAR